MSLLLDGYEAQRPNEGIHLSVARGRGRIEPPPTRRSSSVIPFRAGRRLTPGYADSRRLELVGWVTKPDPEELVAELDALKVVFDPSRDPWLLLDTLPNGDVRWIRVVGANLMGAYRNPHTYDLSAELIADDPFWYSAYGTSTLDSGLVLDAVDLLDQGGPIVVTPTAASHPINFDSMSTGDVERIRIRLVGPSSTGVGIEVDTPDGVVGFVMASALSAGQVLIVDNHKRTALIGTLSQRQGMTLRAANRHGEFIRFRPGVNQLRVLGQPGSAHILFTRTYL